MSSDSSNPDRLKERRKLEREQMRLEVIRLFSEENISATGISRQLNISRPTVYKWVNHYKSTGSRSVSDQHRSGRKPKKAAPPETDSIEALRRQESTITQKTLADVLSLSTATVSLALANSPKISEVTRKRVHTLAQKLNYKANQQARINVYARWNKRPRGLNLAVIYSDTHQHSSKEHVAWQRQHYAETIQALKESTQRLGYQLIPVRLNENENLKSVDKRLLSMNVSGLFILQNCSQHMNPINIQDLSWQNYASLTINWKWHPLPLCNVAFNDEQMVRDAFEQVFGRGYRRSIAVFAPMPSPHEVLPNSHRIHSWMKAVELKNRGKKILPPLTFQTGEIFRKQLEKYLRENRIEAVVSDEPEVYQILKSGKIDASDDICFLSLPPHASNQFLKDSAACSTQNSKISGYSPPQPEYLCETAAQLIDTMLLHNRYGVPETASEYSLFPRWNEGDTLPYKIKENPYNSIESAEALKLKKSKQIKPLILKNSSLKNSHFQTIDLKPYFNGWRDTHDGLFGVEYYLHGIDHGLNWHGEVPFLLSPSGRPNLIAMQSKLTLKTNSKTRPTEKLEIKINKKANSLHFLHFCGFVSSSKPFAKYLIRYHDGSEICIPLRALGEGPTKELIQEATIQDWWPSYPPLVNDAATAIPVSDKRHASTDLRFIYALKWNNPHPSKRIEAITAATNSEVDTTLYLLAITLEI